jgi:hypothetical protein
MSLVNEALKKAERLRSGQPSPEAARADYASGNRAETRSPPGRRQFLAILAANAVILVIFLVIVMIYFRPRQPASVNPPVNSPVTAAVLPPAPSSAPVTRSSSPAVDLPSGTASAQVPATDPASEQVQPAAVYFLPPAAKKTNAVDYDLIGMTVVGKDTLLSIFRRSDKRSVWVSVGKTVGEITAVSYDPAADQAVIRVNGKLRTIGMRNGSPGSD